MTTFPTNPELDRAAADVIAEITGIPVNRIRTYTIDADPDSQMLSVEIAPIGISKAEASRIMSAQTGRTVSVE